MPSLVVCNLEQSLLLFYYIGKFKVSGRVIL